MNTVSHDGRTTAYRVVRADADGPTLLSVHGSGGTHRVWAPQYGANGPGHPTVALDFRSSHTFDVRERLDEISVPVLALVGEHDGLTPPSYHEFLAREIPGGEVSVLDDAAHLAMLDRPMAFTGAIADFLAAQVC